MLIPMLLVIGGIAAAWLGYHAGDRREVYEPSPLTRCFQLATLVGFLTMFVEIAIPDLGNSFVVKDARFIVGVVMFSSGILDLLLYRAEAVIMLIRDIFNRSR